MSYMKLCSVLEQLCAHVASCPKCSAIEYNKDTGNVTVSPDCDEGRRLQEEADEARKDA